MNDNVITPEYLESMGYDFEEVSQRIFKIKNFASQEDLDDVFSIINSKTEEDWKTHYMDGLRGLAQLKYGRDDLDNLIEEGKIEVTQHWIDKNIGIYGEQVTSRLNEKINKLFTGFPELSGDAVGTVQRQYAGVPLGKHVDNHSDPSLYYAAIIYINDDYVDGELYFTNQGIQLRPEPGSLVLFPTGEEYEHGVHAPGEGPLRYVIPCFISKKGFYGKGIR